MERKINRLSPNAIGTMGPGQHPDGRGLYLQVKGDSRSWVFRYMLAKKARYMGLGAFPAVSLAKARRQSDRAHELLTDGKDPIEERRQHRQAVQLEAAKALTFEECAKRYIDAHKAGWRSAKHATQWGATLGTYAHPMLGSLPVQSVDTGLVSKAIDPIWREKPETASRLRQRIEAVLDWATAHGYRNGDNPARWRGHLDKLFPKRSKVRAVKHHKAMPYAELPAFFKELATRETVSARALAFTILTAARSGETRGAVWSEIDRAASLWTVPAERTKSEREHRVPLTRGALSVLDGLDHLPSDQGALLFPNPRGKPLSDTAIRKYLQQDLGRADLTVHGFRSTFRDWAAERTNFPRELAESALAHVLRDKTEAAYQRGDMLDKRRKLMEAWAKFCVSGEAAGGKIVPIHAAG